MDKESFRLTAAANACGVSVGEYVRRRRKGWKWCWRCRKFHRLSAFGVDRSRADGLMTYCKKARKR